MRDCEYLVSVCVLFGQRAIDDSSLEQETRLSVCVNVWMRDECLISLTDCLTMHAASADAYVFLRLKGKRASLFLMH